MTKLFESFNDAQRKVKDSDEKRKELVGKEHKDRMHKLDNIQQTLSKLANYIQKRGISQSQPQQNPRNIPKVEVQDGNSPLMHKEKPMMMLESDERIDHPTPSPLHENRDVEKFKKMKSWMTLNLLLPMMNMR